MNRINLLVAVVLAPCGPRSNYWGAGGQFQSARHGHVPEFGLAGSAGARASLAIGWPWAIDGLIDLSDGAVGAIHRERRVARRAAHNCLLVMASQSASD